MVGKGGKGQEGEVGPHAGGPLVGLLMVGPTAAYTGSRQWWESPASLATQTISYRCTRTELAKPSNILSEITKEKKIDNCISSGYNRSLSGLLDSS